MTETVMLIMPLVIVTIWDDLVVSITALISYRRREDHDVRAEVSTRARGHTLHSEQTD